MGDYMHLKMADITIEIPLSKLKIILQKNGFSPSDIFNKNPEALEVVGKAMKSKSYLTATETHVEEEPAEDPYEGLNIKIKEWEPSETFDFTFGEEKEDEKSQKQNMYKDDVVEKISSKKKERFHGQRDQNQVISKVDMNQKKFQRITKIHL